MRHFEEGIGFGVSLTRQSLTVQMTRLTRQTFSLERPRLTSFTFIVIRRRSTAMRTIPAVRVHCELHSETVPNVQRAGW